MKLVFLDAETFYDDDYSLSRMPTAAYVRDVRFEAIGYSMAINDGPVSWHTGDARQIAKSLGSLSWWRDVVLVTHNAFFDAVVLALRFGIVPGRCICTLSMARALGLDHKAGASLAALADLLRSLGYAIPRKGDEVVRAKGKRRVDFTPDALGAYGAYCCNDTEICRHLFRAMVALLPVGELVWHDIAIRMAACPVLRLNYGVLQADLVRVRERKAELMATLAQRLGVQSIAQIESALASSAKMTRILELLGGALPPEWFADETRYLAYLHDRDTRTGGVPVEFGIPVKPSPSDPSRLIFAYAKTDEGLMALAESGNPVLDALVAARLGVKSTIEETRLEKLIALSKFESLSVPVKISGAHTHRLSGDDGINMQNLPSGRIDGQSDAMRVAIEAPEGCVIVAGDSKQVEARTLAYEANQRDLLRLFATGGDPYVDMAAEISSLDAQAIRDGAQAGDAVMVRWRQTGKAVVLGAGFGMGWERFAKMARAQHGVVLAPQMAQHAIEVYRQSKSRIVFFWSRCGDVLDDMIAGGSGWFGGPHGKLFFYDGARVLFGVPTPGVRLPDGVWLNYPCLRRALVENRANQTMDDEVVYDRRRGYAQVTTKLFGAKFAENLTQALAFAVMKWQARRIAQRYRVLLNEHDAWVTAVRHEEADEARAYVAMCMRAVPAWVDGLPLDCEVGAGPNYGSC
jgi:DNA polymerase